MPSINAALRIPTTNKRNKTMFSAKATTLHADQKLFALLEEYKDLSQAEKENSKKWKGAHSKLPDAKSISGWPLFPTHLEYFYPADPNWKNILVRHLGCGGGHLSRDALYDFNESVLRWSQKRSEESKKEIRRLMPTYDLDEEEEHRKQFEIIASFNDKRIEWFKKEMKSKSRARSKVGLPAIERKGDELGESWSKLNDQIMGTKPNTREGFKAKADWILEEADLMKSRTDNWEFLQVKALVSGIKEFL